jgi:hypothetical protein
MGSGGLGGLCLVPRNALGWAAVERGAGGGGSSRCGGPPTPSAKGTVDTRTSRTSARTSPPGEPTLASLSHAPASSTRGAGNRRAVNGIRSIPKSDARTEESLSPGGTKSASLRLATRVSREADLTIASCKTPCCRS